MFYQVLMNYLESATYAVDNAIERIDYAVLRGRITALQAESLLTLARSRATEPTLTEQVKMLEQKLGLYRSLIPWETIPVGTEIPAGTVVLCDGVLSLCHGATVRTADCVPTEDPAHWMSA